MAFSINTNLGALKAYNALAQVNSQAQRAQFRLATGKRINSVADDTSGFAVGKSLQSKAMVQKSQLNNAGDAKNYLATAETALMQINDLITEISIKYADSQDPSKSKDSIASDIRSIASEIDSILKTTKYNDTNLLAQADGSALASSNVFDIGSDVTMDFAGSNYLNVDAISEKINGVFSTGVGLPQSETKDENATTDTIKIQVDITFADGTTAQRTSGVIAAGTARKDITANLYNNLSDATIRFLTAIGSPGNTGFAVLHMDNWSGNNTDKYITKVELTDVYDSSPVDLMDFFGMPDGFGPREAGLTASSDTDVLSAASDVSTISSNVKSALGRIGNLTQTLDYKSDFLTASITNSTSSISRLFDTDMAAEQLNAAKGSIAGNAATAMLSQLNFAPQNLLQLLG